MAKSYIWNSWLPAQVAAEAEREEPIRFKAAVRGFQDAVDAAKTSSDPNNWATALPWIPVLKTLVSTKTQFDKQVVTSLIHTLMDVVLSTSQDVEVQVRFGELLAHVLRHYRKEKDLGLELQWRPLYNLMLKLFRDPVPQLQGALLAHARHVTLFGIITRSRRFFPATAPAEIWGELRPAFQGDPSSPAAFEALGWLVIFMPTKQLPSCDPALVNTWVCEWMNIWGRLVHDNFWDSHWMYLLARVAKDDWKGIVSWGPHLPRLYTHMLWSFQVPVGTATAQLPFSHSAPHQVLLLFGGKVDQVDDRSKSAAKLALHLLKQPDSKATAMDSSSSLPASSPQATSALCRGASLTKGASSSLDAASGGKPPKSEPVLGSGVARHGFISSQISADEEPITPDVEGALDAFDALVQLLEQYCHPSNSGSWSHDLAVFLRQVVHYFMKQISKQGGGGWPGEARLVPAVQRRFVTAALKLASRGQYSKKDSLVSACCKALCHLSYVYPEEVLPLVVQRFQSALETATAMHQLPTAITTLAMCVRPMLLAGWSMEGETTKQVIAEAMMAVLPGIDANDESKTAAVFQLYTAVLSSVPALRGVEEQEEDQQAPGGNNQQQGVFYLPLYLEDWVEQVMQRLFTLLQNLDTGPGHRADQLHGKPDLLLRGTHLGKETMYTSFFHHLLQRLPERVAEQVVSQLADFALGSSLPSVSSEAGSMYRSAATFCPQLAMTKVVKPLVAKLMKELPEPGTKSVSRTLEDTLTWRLVILGSAVGALGPDAVKGLLPELEPLIDAGLQVPSRVAHNWVSLLLSSICGSLTSYHLPPTKWSTIAPQLNSAPQVWVDKHGTGCTAPQWESPGPEHVEKAEHLVSKYLQAPAQELARLCSSSSTTPSGAATTSSDDQGSVAFKLKCQSLIWSISAVSVGLMARLREFEGIPGCQDSAAAATAAGDSSAGPAYGVIGSAGVVVGSPGVKNRVAAAVATAMRHLRGGDRELLEQLLAASMMLLCTGMMDHLLGGQAVRPHASREDAAITEEPGAATAFMLDEDFHGDVPKWRKRMPVMSALDRVKRMMLWRAGQSAFRCHADVGLLEVEFKDLPKEYQDLLGEVVQLSMFPYNAMRATAYPTLQSCMKRFPSIAQVLLPQCLAAIAGVSPPSTSLLEATSAAPPQQQEQLQAFLSDQLRDAMLTVGQQDAAGPVAAASAGAADVASAARAALTSAVAAGVSKLSAAGLPTLTPPGSKAGKAKAPAASTTAAGGGKAVASHPLAALSGLLPGGAKPSAAATESENDGRVLGACTVINSSIEIWRFIFRDPLYFTAALRALMASRRHSSTNCQNMLSNLLLQVASRFKIPAALDMSGPEYSQLQGDFLKLAEPGTLRGAWRYSVLCNVFTLFLSPPVESTQAVAVARHCLALLRSDMLLLRQLGGAGLWMQLSALVEHGSSNPDIVNEVKQALLQPGSGEELARLLVLNHAKLDAAEAAKDKRGGGLGGLGGLPAQLMAMTFEEMVSALVQSVIERYDKWPSDGDRPSAIRAGLFEVGHARLMRLIAVLCPDQLINIFKEPLQQRMATHSQPVGPSEKAEQATVVEVTAALMAAAAPCTAAAGGGDGAVAEGGTQWVVELLRSALGSTTLELADSWGVGVRYALDYLLRNVQDTTAAAGGFKAKGHGSTDLVPTAAAQECLSAVLDAVLTVPGGRAGSGLPNELKRLKYIRQAVAALHAHSSAQRLAAEGQEQAAAEPPKAVRAFLGGVMQELALLLEGEQPGALRELVGGLLSDLCAYFASAVADMPVVNSGTVSPGGSVADSLGGSLVMVEDQHNHQHNGIGDNMDISNEQLADSTTAAGGIATAAADSGESTPLEIQMGDGEPMVLVLHSSMSSLETQARGLVNQMLSTFKTHCSALQTLKGSGTTGADIAPDSSSLQPPNDHNEDVVMVDRPSAVAPSTPTSTTGVQDDVAAAADVSTVNGTTGAPEDLQKAVSQVGAALQFIAAAIRGNHAGTLRPLLLSMLHGLFQLQELSGPGVQQLSQEAKHAFVLIKYLPLQHQQVAPASASVSRAGRAGYWSTRAAGMVYLQCLWFRHCFLLGLEDMEKLQGFVVRSLQDSKVEVRNIAAATLSGMIKGMPASEAAQLRSDLLSQATSSFGAVGGRRRRAHGSSKASTEDVPLVKQLACIQGLKAFVMSTPYDCPAWMPGVLMALVAAAGAKAPQVRKDASKALSEFKRTHEQDSIDELKRLLQEEQWEAYQQVTSQASYFV